MPSRAHDAFSKKVLRVDAAAPLSAALGEFRRRRASHVAVFAQGQCLGASSFSDADLSSGDATFDDLVRHQPCPTVSDATSLDDLGQLFSDAKTDALVVNNDQGEYVGVVTRQSLLEASRQNNEPFQITDRNAQVGIFHTTASGEYLSVDARWCEITGMPQELALGNGWGNAIHPEDRDRIVQQWSLATKEKQPFAEEYRFLTPAKGPTWVLGQVVAETDSNGVVVGYVGIVTDVTDRKKAAASLIEMNVALSNAMPGISRLDIEGRYVEVNDFYARALGFEPQELIGNSWSPTVHPEDVPVAIEAYEAMCRAGKSEFEARAVRKDQSLFHKRVLMVRIDDANGVMTGHHCFMRDISE